VKIPLEYIEAYVTTFYPSRDPSVIAEYQGGIDLDGRNSFKRNPVGSKPTTSPINILPLLQLCLYAPQFRRYFSYSEHFAHPYYDVVRILFKSTRPRIIAPGAEKYLWPPPEMVSLDHVKREQRKFWYSQAMTKILIHPPVEKELERMDFHFRKEYAEPWMRDLDKEGKEYKDFLDYLDLEKMWCARLVIVIDED
jgi:hypothetical protein